MIQSGPRQKTWMIVASEMVVTGSKALSTIGMSPIVEIVLESKNLQGGDIDANGNGQRDGAAIFYAVARLVRPQGNAALAPAIWPKAPKAPP